MFAFPASLLPVTLRRVGAVSLACATLALTACGGGSRATDYKPASIVSFGDEGSAFAAVTVPGGTGGVVTGLTYSVNVVVDGSTTFCTDQTADSLCTTPVSGVTSFTLGSGAPYYGYFGSVNTGTVFNVVTRIDLGTGDYAAVTGGSLKRTVDQFYNCKATTIWTQYLARAFGKGYEANCQLDQPGAVSYAAAGAKVGDLVTQIAAAKSAGRLQSGALVTVWLGQNDIIEIFEDAAVTNKTAAVATRAATLIDGVKQILATGAKVVLVNAPNLAYSPYALTKNAQTCAGVSGRPCNPDMEALVVAFNKQLITSLGTEYALNGRQLGYVDAAQLTNTYARSTSYENKALCADSLQPLSCHNQNLVTGGNTSTYLWADGLRVSWTLHNIIGQTAFTRATGQF